MLDVAIVGGGLCGLALAHSLHARYQNWALVDARDRLGGRVLTRRAANGAALDLGPCWYWPSQQPSIARLVEDLALGSFPQADDGRVLRQTEAGGPATPVALGWQPDGQLGPLPPDQAHAAEPGAVHGGARRVQGGMATLVEHLAQPLPAKRLHLGWRLVSLHDEGDHLRLECQAWPPGLAPARAQPAAWDEEDEPTERPSHFSLRARRVVLALPPRLAAHLEFQPGLAPELLSVLRATPTWMATAAKAALACERPVWQEAGHTGNAWVQHPQAVLSEVAEATQTLPGRHGQPGTLAPALGAFLALNAQQRQAFATSLPLLVRNQLAQLFGPELDHDSPMTVELHLRDWARDPLTAAPEDLAEDSPTSLSPGHPHYGHPLLLQPHWGGRLLFGGSETARLGGGYLEGALSAAARLRRQVVG